jgi:hypothetical protein
MTEAPFREDLKVDATGGLKGAFVYVSKGLVGTTYPVPETSGVLDPKGRLGAPCVLGVRIGLLPHPCFSASDETGAFTIPRFPEGKPTITLWQERTSRSRARWSFRCRGRSS